MANKTILTDLSVEVDNVTVLAEANSITFMEGHGETSVKTASQGGTLVSVHSKDVSTMVGKIKIDSPSSIDAMNDAKVIGDKKKSIVVKIHGTDQTGKRIGRTLRDARLVNDPEKAVANEGTFSLEFEGLPLISS